MLSLAFSPLIALDNRDLVRAALFAWMTFFAAA